MFGNGRRSARMLRAIATMIILGPRQSDAGTVSGSDPVSRRVCADPGAANYQNNFTLIDPGITPKAWYRAVCRKPWKP